jgi:DNA-binding CsgD family transcriptional regulator/tetratricopeptide (TPR) repeat protein
MERRNTTVQTSAVSSTGIAGELLERSLQLSALRDALAAVRDSSHGRVVLLAGEAGVGKTALVKRFGRELGGSTRLVWGACDPLFTPRPLAPVLDISETLGEGLGEAVASGARPHEIVSALMRELAVPTIVVLEDLHWADEATLDVLRLLGRKVEAVPALVLATYRDDELASDHPLRVLVGEFATEAAVSRVKLAPLSPTAVAELAAPHGVDADALYRKTGGNPFFVTEVLAAGEGDIPETVRDAVLARAVPLSPAAREVLEAVAVAPPEVDVSLLEQLVEGAVDRIDEGLTAGMLTAESGALAFRHELARRAIEESIAPDRALGLHRKALAALASPPSGDPDVARLAHHAEAAQDADAVLSYAPRAGEHAASLGAHREAAAQYGRALRFADGLTVADQARLLERRSYECYLIDQFEQAIGTQRQAVELHRELGDALREGAALSVLARRIWCSGQVAGAEEACREAITLLEQLPPGPELAMAYATASAVCLNSEDAEGTAAWGERALGLAERLGETEVVVYTLNNLGTMALLRGDQLGGEALERSLELARRARLDEHAGRAFIHLGWVLARNRAYELDDRIDAGIEYCFERGLDLWGLYVLTYRARSQLDRGRWNEAADTTAFVLRHPRDASLLRTLALVVLGLLRARQGDPDAWVALDEARSLAEASGELQGLVPVAAARAETHWLAGEHDAVAAETDLAFEEARRRSSPWAVGELACWRWRAGVREEIPTAAAEPFALEIAGEWARAAELWSEIGCPYEAALALAGAESDEILRQSLRELQGLGAGPAAAIVSLRLRERGARGLPRGPRPATRDNPAGLTSRESEVLALVSRGLRNWEIADHLFLSEKTVAHHVSAILRKLDVQSRGQAALEAARLGLADQDR